MGYDLSIGEMIQNKETDEEGFDYIDISVKGEKHDNAPAFGEPTDHTNERWPSYTVWANFCRFVDLYDLFYNKENGILRNHPGEVILKDIHKKRIDKAMIEFKKKYPGSIAGYSTKIDFKKEIFEDPEFPIENNWLCRLEWLKYWVDWSLKNCKKPIFKNT